jgi:formylmethanofuran dehydrogenase subunit E
MVLLGDEAQLEARMIRLQIVLILTQDRCMVCAERTIGLEIILDAPMELLVDVAHGNFILVRSEMVLVSEQDRCTVCTKCTIGS